MPILELKSFFSARNDARYDACRLRHLFKMMVDMILSLSYLSDPKVAFIMFLLIALLHSTSFLDIHVLFSLAKQYSSSLSAYLQN